jgi:tyrosinase
MNYGEWSRREFLQATGIASTALFMGGCESCRDQIENRPIRRNIANLAANDPIIQAFKDGVQAMKNLPASDPRSWTAQANIHFDHCPHGNWWFLPWHRGYLLYFERIIRKLSGHQDFALPYWNWTSSPSIPSHFWGNGNPLLNTTRFVGPADTADPSWIGATVIGDILDLTNFYTFASSPATSQRQRTTEGMLESTPHDNIHGWVGGDMGAFHSPLDAVFWCHHNILDCLWNEWNVNRGNANTNNQAWYDLHFTEFVDQDGNAVDITAGITVLFTLFNYRFEACGPAHVEPKFKDRAALEAFLRRGGPVTLEFGERFELGRAVSADVGQPVRSVAKLTRQQMSPALESGGDRALLLSVEGVDVPKTGDYFVRVFLGKADAGAGTPITDPHYAGSFGFFSDPAMASMPNMKPDERFGYLVDLSGALRRLNRAGALPGDTTDVTLVPVPYDKHDARGQRLTIERMALSVARVK